MQESPFVSTAAGPQHSTRPKLSDLILYEGILLVPYVEVNGARSVPDSVLEAFWEKARAQGLDRRTYGEATTTEKFLGLMKSPANIPTLLYLEGASEPFGVAYLNGAGSNHCFAHFVYLKEVWGKKTLQAGWALCRYWFNIVPELDVIVGNIASDNARAVKYVQRLGWKRLGEIPYMANRKPATIVYTVGEHWRI